MFKFDFNPSIGVNFYRFILYVSCFMHIFMMPSQESWIISIVVTIIR